MSSCSNSQTAYDAQFGEFEAFCEGQCPKLLVCFMKNWQSCVTMWSNHARDGYFSAGNTTTNRIESNWNQLKILLGKKTLIDKTVGGLLSHQMTIIRQQLTGMRKHSSTSRQP